MANTVDNMIRYLARLADFDRAAGMARGSTMARRARNAERSFLDTLADDDWPQGEMFTPRDVARMNTDRARRDARMGPFRPDDLNANAWQWMRDSERSLVESRAAQKAFDQATNQFLGRTAASTAGFTGLATGVTASILAGRERARKEQEAIDAYMDEAAQRGEMMRQREADQNYGWDDEAEAKARRLKETLASDLPMADYGDPLGEMVPDMPMEFDYLPPAPAQSQSDTAALQMEYKTPPGAMTRRKR